MAPNYLVFLLAVFFAKVLRLRGKPMYGVAYEAARIVELPQLAPATIEILAAKLHECEAQGFVQRFGLSVPMVGAVEGANVVLSNRERTILAECVYARMSKRLEVVVAPGFEIGRWANADHQGRPPAARPAADPGH